MLLSITFAMPSYRPGSSGAVAVVIAITLWLIAVAGEVLTDR